AQRYAAIRGSKARALSLGWPLLCRTARRLGDTLHIAGVIAAVDVFFLSHAELTAGMGADAPRLADPAAARRTAWPRQRRLPAPPPWSPTAALWPRTPT